MSHLCKPPGRAMSLTIDVVLLSGRKVSLELRPLDASSGDLTCTILCIAIGLYIHMKGVMRRWAGLALRIGCKMCCSVLSGRSTRDSSAC